MSEELKRSIGTAVRAARQRAGLTQDELAAQIGKTPESISNIERGKQSPAIETLTHLARALAVPISDFFDDVGNKPAMGDSRLRAEAHLRELVRGLDDEAFGLVVEQVAAFARYAGKDGQ